MLISQTVADVFIFPGQGSQYRGMGKGLFERFPEVVAQAEHVLGYAIKDLCLNDPQGLLGQTQYTQVAMYLVNHLHYLAHQQASGGTPPRFVIGHSLGEYNALLVADVYDFGTGLSLVQQRGRLFQGVHNGGMMAVMGQGAAQAVASWQTSFPSLDAANINHEEQVILSGPVTDLQQAEPLLTTQGFRAMPLNVSGPFHSRYMRVIEATFDAVLQGVSFRPAQVTVFSNVAGTAYTTANSKDLLLRQISNPVAWKEQVYKVLSLGGELFAELGPGQVLTRMVAKNKEQYQPAAKLAPPVGKPPQAVPAPSFRPDAWICRLGSGTFCDRYQTTYPYVTGGMYKAIASVSMVVRMSQAGLLSFLGTGGIRIEQISQHIDQIQAVVGRTGLFGVNLLHTPQSPDYEIRQVALLLEKGVRVVEAAAFGQPSLALLYFRYKGIYFDQGRYVAPNRVMVKLAHPDVARSFLAPPAPHLLSQLVERGLLSQAEATAAKQLAPVTEVTIESDSGGHTNQACSLVLTPNLLQLVRQLQKQHGYRDPIHVGAAGGLGTPQAIAAAFLLGVDYVLTGSINQCTVEAGTSDQVKQLLSQASVHDTTYAPAGDMLELGAKVQVLRRGVLFPARANRLQEIYRQHDRIDQIELVVRQQLQTTYFQRDFDEVWGLVQSYIVDSKPEYLDMLERNPKLKMAQIFKWYFFKASEFAIEGKADRQADYQIQCGSAMGAFNQWAKGTDLEDWRNRHVDEIAIRLLKEAQQYLTRSPGLRA